MAYVRFVKYAVCLSVSVLMISCSGLEMKGDSAYSRAKGAQGNQKQLLEKEAYIYYRQAVRNAPDKTRISNKLRNRFIETTLNRAAMVLDQGTSEMDALKLFIEDIDSTMTADVRPELKETYAELLNKMADSTFAHGQLTATFGWLDKALQYAQNGAPIAEKKVTLSKNLVNEKVELAKMQLDEGKTVKDEPIELVRAEFNAKLALYYDPNNEEAKKILSEAYKANRSVYSAYQMAIEDRPDSNVFRAINKYTILLAIPAVKEGGGVTCRVSMFNYSWNPLRLWARDFYLEDVNGKRVAALPSSKIDPEILDQERETTKLVLNFPKPEGEIKRMVYETQDKEYYTEKNFF